MAKLRTIGELAKKKRLRVAGLMSGTSTDGVDVAIVDISTGSRNVIAFGIKPYPAAVRTAVLRLCNPKSSNVADICHYNFLLSELKGSDTFI
jgi:anhydro-N-acetylmuramic acid kinase